MKKQHYKQKVDVQGLIESRLSMQSTQRNLLSFGVTIPTIRYILSPEFYSNKYINLTEYQKRNILQLLAGPFEWEKARTLIENTNN